MNILKGGERALHKWNIVSRQSIIFALVLTGGFLAGWGGHMKIKTTPAEWHAASDAWLSMGRVRHYARSSRAYRAWVYQARAGLQPGMAGMILGGFLLLLVFNKFGNISDKNHKRGSTLVSSQQLSRLVRRRSKNGDPDLELCGVPLPHSIELKHILMIGSTGVGKSTAMRQLLDQIREEGERAIVFDPGGHFLSEYAQEGDVLLNPFDRRSDNWSIFHEIDSERDAVRISQSLVTGKEGKDDGFVNGARAVLSSLIWKLHQSGQRDMQKLYDWLILSSHEDLAEYLKGSPGARHIGSGAAEQASGMLSFASEAAPSIKAYAQASHLHSEPPFSLRQWVREGTAGSIVWLPVQKSHISEVLPLVGLWLDLAASELMGMGESDGKRRLWFFADEVASLNKMSSLPVLLAEGRKYGGVGVLGFQNMAQLRLKYGRDGAASLLDLLSTKVIFRSSDPEVAKYSSDLLGEAEVERKNEGEQMGRGGRDGTNLSQQVLREPLVMPSQIQNLPDFEAYMALPGDYPHALVHTEKRNDQKLHPAFSEVQHA